MKHTVGALMQQAGQAGQASSSSVFERYVSALSTVAAAHMGTSNVLQALEPGFIPDQDRLSYCGHDHLIVTAAFLGLNTFFIALLPQYHNRQPSSIYFGFPLHLAASHGYQEIATLLASHKVPTSECYQSGCFPEPLDEAALAGQSSMVQLLMSPRYHQPACNKDQLRNSSYLQA
jgi:hypothetical protein